MAECYSAAIVDVDGVLWRGSRPLTENLAAIRKLLESDVRIVFLTNNSTRTRRHYGVRISRLLGTRVSEDMVVNSGYSASVWLREKFGSKKVLIVGMEGLAVEASLQGHLVLDSNSWREADAVLVGLDRGLTYQKLANAHKAIVRGALFVATNTDRAFPVEDGTEPGAGAIVESLRASTGIDPLFDAGKPGKWILELALRRLEEIPRDRIVVVGDRLDTDMRMAVENGLPGILVLTGITREPPREPLPRVSVYRNLLEAVEKGVFCGIQ